MMLSEPIKESMPPDQTCQRLTLAQVQLATNNFDQALVIGGGGFGKVYKSLSNFGSSINEVAIKRLNSSSSQGANEFEAEVKILSKLRHGNLVPLIGYCSEGKEMVLAYEFMPNGTLEKHLKRGDTELSWLQRLKICIGAARGLDYLHTGTSTRHGVIHRDVKTSNILLDSNFDAKISDFGLAKVGAINQTQTHVSTLVKGTFGYMDPCYFYSGKLTRKSDVYAFGVVLFEVLSGKQAVDPTLDEDQWSLAVWAQDHFKAGKLNEIIDHRLIGQVSKKSLKEFASIAVLCLHSHPKQRPTMAEVVVKLESILSRDSESAGSGADDGRFFNKVRYLLTGKADLMLAHAEGSKSETSAQYIQKTSNISLRVFTYAELVSATEKCNDKGFSTNIETSYKGWVDELTYAPTKPGVGLAIYVWTRHIGANMPDLNSEQFNHPNLAKLVGYYLNEHKLSCVSERRPSLDKILFGEPGITPLSWDARLKIALGTAQGLSFLHKKGHPAYREFTITCITVDADYNARLQDFEMSRPWTFYGNRSYYAAPEGFDYDLDVLDGVEFCRDGSLLKGEIYSFGVVLLEILTGMKVFDPNRPKGKQHLVAQPKGKQDLVAQFQDNNNHPPKEAFMLAELVLNCLQPVRDERPLTEKILRVLLQCYHETI